MNALSLLRSEVRAPDAGASPIKGRHAPPDFSRQVVCVLGLPFDVVDMDQAVQRVRDASAQRRRMLLATANINFLIAAQQDHDFRLSVIHSHLSLADGMPIVWISRLLGLPIKQRVPGSGLFERLCRAARAPADDPIKVYFFGGPDGVAEAAHGCVNMTATGVRSVGHDSPGFGSVEALSRTEQITRINHANPDFLVISLGAHKGQAWIERNQHQLEAPVISHLGAVVNFASGRVKRAPGFMQRTGLEWLWRIVEEPALWRRYLRDAQGLCGLLASSVLPLWWQRVTSALRPRSAGMTAHVTWRGEVAHLRLSGCCDYRQSEVLAEALTKVASGTSDVVIDLARVDYIDAAAMGSLLLLYGWQCDIGRPLLFRGMSARLRRQFSWHRTEFMLEPGLRPTTGSTQQVRAA